MHSLIKNLDRSLAKYLAGLLPEERRYLLLVPVTGIVAGAAAVALEKLLAVIQAAFWGTSHEIGAAASRMAETSPWTLLLILATGGLVVVVANLFLRKGNRLQGTSRLMEALAFKKGRLPVLETLLEGVVSITAVGAGASLGREGAMMNSGATLGSWLGAKLHLEDHHVKVLLASGAAGGIAAAYNVPISASVFAMEVILGSFALELFGPIIVCSLISTLISRDLLGSGPVYNIPPHELTHELEILLHLILGVLLGLVSVLFIRVFSGIDELFRWLRPLEPIKALLAMVALGAVSIFFPWLLGNGYDTVNLVLKGDALPLSLLLVLPVLKILVTALCRAGGVPGGLFTPSLFVGALVGDAFGLMARKIFPQASMSQPVIYALVGMGAILAGTIQAPITAILMVFEMTHDYGIILPLMSASIASALVSHLLQAGSLYTEPLLRRGIRLPPALAPTWLREPTLKGVIIPGAATVSPAESFAKLMETFLKAPEGQDQLYVTNSEGAYLGAISLHEIKSSFRETGNLDSVIAADVFNPSFPCVYAGDPISKAAELLAESDFERLPVLDGPVSRKLLGTVSKRKLLSAYREANLPHLEVRRSPHSPPEGTDRSPHNPPHNPPEGTDRSPLDSPKDHNSPSPGNSSHEEPMLTENECKEKSR